MKKVYQIFPFSIYDFAGIEHWLEQQANRGLFPVSLHSLAVFTPTGVPGTRFRLVVKDRQEAEPSAEQIELSQEAGWTFSGCVADLYFLFYTTDADAVEFYTDLESRGITLAPVQKQLARYRRRQWLIYSVLAIAVIWSLFFFESQFDVQPDHLTQLTIILLNLFQPSALLFVACAALLWQKNRHDRKTLSSLYQSLVQGLEPPAAPGPSKAIVRRQIVLSILLVPLAGSMLLHTFDGLNPWKEIPLEQFSAPYTSIQAIEREPVLPWEELFEEAPFAEVSENYANKKFSLLAPAWYSVTQNGYSPQSGSQENVFSPKPVNGEARYAPSFDAAYYDLLLSALARPVAMAQMDAYRLVNLTWSYESLDDTGLDFAIYATEPGDVWQMLAIGKGSRVAVFRYAGREQLPDHLQELSRCLY